MFDIRCSFYVNSDLLNSERVVVKLPEQQAESQTLHEFINKFDMREVISARVQGDIVLLQTLSLKTIKLQINTNLLGLTAHYMTCLSKGFPKELFLLDVDESVDGLGCKRTFFTFDEKFSDSIVESFIYEIDFNILSYLHKIEPREYWQGDKLFNEARLAVIYEKFFNHTMNGQIQSKYLGLKKDLKKVKKRET